MRLKLYEEFIDEYYSMTLSEDEKKGMNTYRGRGVQWFGYPDQMIVVHKDNIHGMWGNIYDHDKLEYVKNMIERSDDYVEFSCSYAMGDIVTLEDIIEQQEAMLNDRFSVDYDGHDEPYSTGDNDLDIYLGMDIEDHDYFWNYDEYIIAVLKENKTLIATGDTSEDKVRAEVIERLEDENYEKYDDFNDSLKNEIEEALNDFFEFENELKEVIDDELGDLGNFIIQLRDAHHRCFGAIAAGEDYVCVNLDIDHIEEYKGHYHKVNQKYIMDID